MQNSLSPVKNYKNPSIEVFDGIIQEAEFQMNFKIIESLLETPGQSKYLLANHISSTVLETEKRLDALEKEGLVVKSGEGTNILYWTTEFGKAHNKLNSNINLNVHTPDVSVWDKIKNYFVSDKSPKTSVNGLAEEDIKKLEERKNRMNKARQNAANSRKIRD